MTVALLARSAVLTVATGAVLLSGMTVAGAASAAPAKDDRGSTSSTKDSKMLKSPTLTVPHGRKLA